MMVLVLGGSASGKSGWAETEAVKLARNGPLCYLATLSPDGPGNDTIIRNHRKHREGKGFFTVEAERNIDRLKLREPEKTTVLLECLSDLLANEMFGDKDRECGSVPEKVIEEVLSLSGKVKNLVIVSDLIFSDGISYEKETTEYMRNLGTVNAAILKEADRAAEIVCTCPVYLK
jgi:adenosylcobinamide kinase/adenosylcobinamide-phosphate guanylyltransferase